MKRKFKLITTIASLTAAIALLVGGVWAAATARTVNVNGTVSFEASNIAATVTVFESTDGGSTWGTALKSLVYHTNGDLFIDGSETAVTGTEYAAQVFAGILDTQLTDDGLKYAYKIVVENDFTANGSSIKVTLTNAYEAPTSPAWVTATEATGSTIVAQGQAEYIYTYVVNPDLAPQIGSFPIGVAVSMERA